MRSSRRGNAVILAVVAIALGVVGPVAAALAAPGSTVSRGYTADGRLSFIGSAHAPLVPPPGAAAVAGPGSGAGVFVSLYGPAFGLRDPDREVRLHRVDPVPGGGSVARYRQVHEGVPVFGGDLVVKTDVAGRLVAMGGKVLARPTVDVAPTVSAEAATATAAAAVAAAYGQGFAARVTGEATLSIYDEALFTESGAAPRLAWKLEISGLPGRAVREVVFVDAHTGTVALRFNRIDTGWGGTRRVTTTPQGGSPSGTVAAVPPTNVIVRSADFLPVNPEDPFDTYTFVCDDGQPAGCDYPAADRDATFARLFSGNTWRFFNDNHAYDFELEVTGNTGIKSLINIDGPVGTDYWLDNAYWDGEKMNYGDGFASAEDVVGHEMTHGFTEATSDLIYLYQSGAINESFSDIWGELVDQAYQDPWGVERDAAADAWFLGEDLPTGALRSMANPLLFGDPDRMLSPYYYRGPLENGGVHRNSGVNNKAAYLMAKGGVFNGRTVAPIGTAKVAQLYYQAQTMLWPGADYYDLYQVLRQACDELTLTTFSAADCQAVGNALLAVQMNLRPATISTGAVAACPAGTVYGQTLFADDFEAGTANWNFSAQDAAGNGITPSWTTSPLGFADPATAGDVTALRAAGPAYVQQWEVWAEESAALVTPLAIPAGVQTHFSFEHLYLFETGWDARQYFWDGALVEYSVDGGATWKDLRARYSAGQNYNGVVGTYAESLNPLRGRAAFVGNSRGGKVWTRYNLTALAGQADVKLRFRIGYDMWADWGWFIDRVIVNTCVPAPTVPVPLAPANGALVYTNEPTLDWSDAIHRDAYAYEYEYEVSTDVKLSPVLQSGRVTASTVTLAALARNTRYYWRVRSVALNDRESHSAWSALRTFRTALETPVQDTPADGAAVGTDRPTFFWSASADAVSYTWQVCRNSTCTLSYTAGATKATQAQPLVDLPPDRTLYWRVRANGVNTSAWSGTRSFLTGNPPTVPVLLTPGVNARTQDATPTFTWRASLPAAGTGDTVDGYEIQIAADTLFADPAMEEASVPATATPAYTSAGLENGRTCYWRVRSVSSALEKSGWTLPRALRIAYAAPVLVSPVDPGVPATNTVTFEWDDVTGQANPTSYTIQVSTNDTFTALLVSGAVVPSALTRTFSQPPGTTLHWRVRANGAYGPGAWSTASFTLP